MIRKQRRVEITVETEVTVAIRPGADLATCSQCGAAGPRNAARVQSIMRRLRHLLELEAEKPVK